MCLLRYEFVHNAIRHEQINEHNELLVITYNSFLGRNKKICTGGNERKNSTRTLTKKEERVDPMINDNNKLYYICTP